LQKVSGKQGGSADAGFPIVGLSLTKTPSSGYEPSEAFVEKQPTPTITPTIDHNTEARLAPNFKIF